MAEATEAISSNISPPRPINVPSGLKSTPMSQGAASMSEHLAYLGVSVAAISPFIERDIRKTELCNVDDMLTEMLRRSSNTPEQAAPDGLLRRCLEQVLPICNGKVGAKANLRASSEVRGYLVDYAKQTEESAGYDPFIMACNTALGHLKHVEVDGMREPSTLDMLVQKNDPHILKGNHQGEQSLRKLDATGVSYYCAKDILSYEKGEPRHWSDCAFVTAKERPKNLIWIFSLCSFEFKRRMKISLKIPNLYTVEDHVRTQPEYLRLGFSALDTNDMKFKVPSKPQTSSGPQISSYTGSSNTNASSSKRKRSESPTPIPTRQQPSRVVKTQGVSKEKPSTTNLVSDAMPSSSKRSKIAAPPNWHRPPPSVQARLYAAEMFAAHVAMTHTFNFVISDNIIWIWYYDRQGNIQSQGIDFLKDLPRFLVLLYAIQRFDLPDWGRNEHFRRTSHIQGKDEAKSVDNKGKTNAKSTDLKGKGKEKSQPANVDINSEPMKDEVKFDHQLLVETGDGLIDLTICTSDPITTHYGLKGRATNVFPVKSKALSEKYKERGISADDLVGKLYWGEKGRTSEAEMLRKVKELAQTNPHIEGHVPELLWYHTFTGSTSAIRERLGLENPTKGSRVLYILVFRKLRPITELQGTNLLKVWWQCVLCHRDLWKNGVHHRDVSCNNLMYYTDEKGRFIGVLNDFDLASLAQFAGPRGNERTGTIPFMALDLLSEKGIRGEVEHLYRHDLESFVWVLVWICMRYKDGALRGRSRVLDEWARADATQCREKKSDFIVRYLHQKLPRQLDVECWTVTCDGLRVFNYERMRQDDWIRQARSVRAGFREDENVGEGFELEDDEIFARFEGDVIQASLTSFA